MVSDVCVQVDSIKPAPAPDVTGCVSGRAGPNRPMPKSASFDDSQTALDVVRTKRAKQLLTEKSSTKFPTTTRTTKSGLSVERTVGCADLVDLEVLSDHLVLGLVWLPHAQASWIY